MSTSDHLQLLVSTHIYFVHRLILGLTGSEVPPKNRRTWIPGPLGGSRSLVVAPDPDPLGGSGFRSKFDRNSIYRKKPLFTRLPDVSDLLELNGNYHGT